MDDGTELTSPEAKFMAQQVLKYLVGNAIPVPEKALTIELPKPKHSAEYKKRYNDIIRKYGKLNEYSAEEISKILTALGGNTGGIA